MGHRPGPSAMFGSSFGALAFRRVCSHRIGDSSFSHEVSVSQVYAVLVFDIRPAAVLLSFQVNCLDVLVETGLITISSGCFEFANECFEFLHTFSTAAVQKFQIILPAVLTAFRGLLLWGSARRRLLAYSLCCPAEFISASTRELAHQPCFRRGRLECGSSLTTVKSMTSAMLVVM